LSNWDVGARAWFKFRTKKQGEKFEAEGETDNMLMDIGLYVASKYPGVELVTSSLAINQKLSERMKV
jgi:hypothetical protein